jgi:Uma2 family endonuclease
MPTIQVPNAVAPELPLDTWTPEWPPSSDQLIYDDGEPLETNRHRIAMNTLIEVTLVALAERPDFFVGGNMFIYYSLDQKMNQDFRGPDFFVARVVDAKRERKSWVVWEEQGHYPDVIVEFLSSTTAKVDTGEKKYLYEKTFRTADYYVYDPFDAKSLQGWHLESAQGYQPLAPNDRGWLWCETLGLWLGTWEGQIMREPSEGTCHWLRLYDREGHLVPLLAEQEKQRADAAQLRAEQAEQSRRDAVVRLLGMNLTIAQVAEALGLPTEEVQSLANP